MSLWALIKLILRGKSLDTWRLSAAGNFYIYASCLCQRRRSKLLWQLEEQMSTATKPSTLKMYPHIYSCRPGSSVFLELWGRRQSGETTRVGELEGGLAAITLHIQICKSPCWRASCLFIYLVTYLSHLFTISLSLSLCYPSSLDLNTLSKALGIFTFSISWTARSWCTNMVVSPACRREGPRHSSLWADPHLWWSTHLLGDSKEPKHPPISPCLPGTYSVCIKKIMESCPDLGQRAPLVYS